MYFLKLRTWRNTLLAGSPRREARHEERAEQQQETVEQPSAVVIPATDFKRSSLHSAIVEANRTESEDEVEDVTHAQLQCESGCDYFKKAAGQ